MTITAPAVNARTAANPLTISGVVTLPSEVTNVVVTWTSLLNGSNGSTNVAMSGSSRWSVQLAPIGGPLLITAQAFNTFGDGSGIVNRKIFLVRTASLDLVTTGSGSVTFSPAASKGGQFVLGNTYLAISHPGKNYLFKGWTLTTNSVSTNLSAANIRFIMIPNASLTANFVTNIYLEGFGTYNGLISPGSNQFGEYGMIYNLVVQRTGAYSGRVRSGNVNVGFTGLFSPSQTASNSLTLGTNELALQMMFNAESNIITGTLTNATVSSMVFAVRAAPATNSTRYTLLIEPPATNANFPANTTNAPGGFGYALLYDARGAVTISGAVADGTTFSESTSASADGRVPLYNSFYTHAGHIEGWIHLADLAPGSTNSFLLEWKMPPGFSTLYPDGFTNEDVTIGSVWTPPAHGAPVISLTNGATVTLTNGSAPAATAVQRPTQRSKHIGKIRRHESAQLVHWFDQSDHGVAEGHGGRTGRRGKDSGRGRPARRRQLGRSGLLSQRPHGRGVDLGAAVNRISALRNPAWTAAAAGCFPVWPAIPERPRPTEPGQNKSPRPAAPPTRPRNSNH